MLWLTLQQLKSKSARTRKSAARKLSRSGDPGAIEPLAHALSDPEADVRKAAAEALGEFKDERSVDALVRALSDGSPEVRETVAGSLKKIGDPRCIDALVHSLRDSHVSVRWRVAQTLKSLGWQPRSDDTGTTFFVALGELDRAARMGSAAVEPLVALLKEGAYQKRVAAVDLLSQMNDPRVVKPLLEALKDSDSLVRTAAANALSRIGDARAVEPLIGALKDSDHNVRTAAAVALARLGDERAVAPLVQSLEDGHWEVRASALESLGKLRDPRCIEAVIGRLADPDKEVRQNAANALSNLGDERALEPLVLALKDEHTNVRQAALCALRKADPYWERSDAARRAMPQIREALKDRDFSVQIAAAEVLRMLGDAPAAERQLATVTDGARNKRQAATNILLTLLDDADADLRQAAAESLGRLGDGRVIDPLARAMTDTHASVRRASARSLEALHWQPQTPAQKAQYLVVQENWTDAVGLGSAAVGPLTQALESGDSRTRLAAISALGRIGETGVAESLAVRLRDKHREVRRAAAETLNALGAQPADPALAALVGIELRDWDRVAQQGSIAAEPLIAFLQARDVEPDALEAAGQCLSRVADADAAGLLAAQASDGRISGAVTAALAGLLAQCASAIPEAALEAMSQLPDVPRYRYEFDAAACTYTREGVEQLDCSALRQGALAELERRRAGVEVPG
jgi:HEAT repeat protein